jgi:hypothetical protein
MVIIEVQRDHKCIKTFYRANSLLGTKDIKKLKGVEVEAMDIKIGISLILLQMISLGE